MVTLDDIRAAEKRIAGRVHRTPLMYSSALAARAGVASVALKCESFQKTGSFKVRGSLNKLAQLSDEQRARGVICASAGNHAQALAWCARAAGVKCTVVMPMTASKSKLAASRDYGAEVIQFGTPKDIFGKAFEVAEKRGMTFVHPFDDDAIIAGAGTVGIEMLEQVEQLPDVVITPVGGGGLIAGIAVAVAALAPDARHYGVEPEGANTMRQSFDAGSAQRAATVSTIADGLAAPMSGERNYAIAREFVDDIIVVSDAQIGEAMHVLLERCKLLTEPAGASSAAALLSGSIELRPTDHVVLVVSGGNVDAEKLKQLL